MAVCDPDPVAGPARGPAGRAPLGTRLALVGQGLNVPYDQTSPVASLAQSRGPVVLGLGANGSIPLIRCIGMPETSSVGARSVGIRL